MADPHQEEHEHVHVKTDKHQGLGPALSVEFADQEGKWVREESCWDDEETEVDELRNTDDVAQRQRREEDAAEERVPESAWAVRRRSVN